MIRIILPVMTFTFSTFIQPLLFSRGVPLNCTTATSRITSRTTTSSSTTTARTPRPGLRSLLTLMKKNYEDHRDGYGIKVIYEDMKRVWNVFLKGGHGESSSDMDDLLTFISRVVDDYNHGLENIYKNFSSAWENYISTFGKEYPRQEIQMRMKMFKENKENMEKHNELYRKGEISYFLKLNQFSDRTREELEHLAGFQADKSALHQRNDTPYYYIRGSAVAELVDWRVKGLVTSVKNQGNCASCYAFAGIGALEAYYKKRTGKLFSLSVQNILDCTWHLGNRGCDGGFIDLVFDYGRSNGVVTDGQYPYTMNATNNCLWEKQDAVATNEGFFAIRENDEVALQHAVAKHGPVAATIGLPNDFYSYGYGVFDHVNCYPVTRSVLIVGYGTDPRHGDYWLVKNSFGVWWGEDGYIRIARNKCNVCYVASYAVFPV